jgi:rare lipoprotein A (peptidoglycan hydrolase)
MLRTGLTVCCAATCVLAGCAGAPDTPFTHMSTSIVQAPQPVAAAPQPALAIPVAFTAPTATAIQPVSPVQTASVPAQKAVALPPLTGGDHKLNGIASYYWQDQMTSSGERFDKRAMTAAHQTLPLGTRVRVTSAVNGRSVVVRINDRGPFKGGRVIDLSEAAAEQLQMTTAGLAPVKIEVVR